MAKRNAKVNKRSHRKSYSTPDSKSVKRAIKFLAVCREPRINQAILKRAPDILLKRICNAALNAERGDVKFSKRHRKILAKYRNPIGVLTDPQEPIHRKRRIFTQRGGGVAAVILPLILQGVMQTLGSLLFQKK